MTEPELLPCIGLPVCDPTHEHSGLCPASYRPAVAAELARLAEQVEQARAERDEWISVKERLPESCVPVLGLFDDSYGWRHWIVEHDPNEGWFDVARDEPIRAEIEYWKPLGGVPDYPPRDEEASDAAKE